MTTITYSATATVHLNGITQAQDFGYTITPKNLVVGGSSVPVTTDTAVDYNYIQNTGSTTYNNFKVNVIDSTLISGHYFTATGGASVDQAGNVAYTTGGAATVNIITPVGNRAYGQNMTAVSTMTNIFNGFKATAGGNTHNTLAYHINTAIANMISGKTATNIAPYYRNLWASNTYQYNSTPSAVRNTNCITNGIDLSFIPVACPASPAWGFPGILISPRHLLIANHVATSNYAATNTQCFTFLSPNGTSQQCVGYTGRAIQSNTPALNSCVDMAILYLDAPITVVSPAKVLPAGWQAYIPSTNPSTSLAYPPALMRGVHNYSLSDQSDALRIWDWTYQGSGASSVHLFKPPADSTKLNWWAQVSGGDSSSPFFVPIDPAGGTAYQAVLLGVTYGFIPGAYTVEVGSIGDAASVINSVMNSLALATNPSDNTVYALQTINLATAFQSTTFT
jgi:hypothetical protein